MCVVINVRALVAQLRKESFPLDRFYAFVEKKKKIIQVYNILL